MVGRTAGHVCQWWWPCLLACTQRPPALQWSCSRSAQGPPHHHAGFTNPVPVAALLPPLLPDLRSLLPSFPILQAELFEAMPDQWDLNA